MSLNGVGNRRVRRDLAPVLCIRGGVSDSEGKPLGNARVATCYADVGATQTGADGRFEIEVQSGRHMHLLRIQHPGHAGARVWVSESDDEIRVEIELAAGGELLGFVQDRDGNAIEGAELSHGECYGRSKSDGSFMITDLPAGRQQLKVKSLGHAACLVPVALASGEAKAGVKITLEPGHDLNGRLLDEHGDPIPSALVCAQVEALDSASRSTFSDQQGRFRLSDLPADTCKVEIAGAGFDTMVASVCLDGTEIVIELATGSSGSGPQGSHDPETSASDLLMGQ